jgi:hypothetical protein
VSYRLSGSSPKGPSQRGNGARERLFLDSEPIALNFAVVAPLAVGDVVAKLPSGRSSTPPKRKSAGFDMLQCVTGDADRDNARTDLTVALCHSSRDCS